MSVVDIVGGTDHKSIAKRIFVTAAIFFVGAGVMALIIRTELIEPGQGVVSTNTYNQLFTMHGSTMIFLVVTPIALALGLYIVPLQIGAPGAEWPRVALLGWWLYVLGGIAMLSGFLAQGGAAKATWVGFDPLSGAIHSPGGGTDLWIAGVTLSVLGAWLLGWCLLMTVVRRRAPGMTLLRMPVFTWTSVVTALMTVFSFPVVIVAMVLLFVERQVGDVLGGGVIYQHLFWFFGHPVVYIMFFPFLGAALEVIATFSGRRFFGYVAFIGSLLLFTTLSMSVWGHHMFATAAVASGYFSLTTTAIILPAGIEYFDAIGTMWGGRIRPTAAFLFAIGFLVEFLIGGLSGIWVASPPIDFHANNSYVVVAHFHFTLVGGSLFGLFAAAYYWWPKVTGWSLREGVGKVHFWLFLIGTNLTFLPQFIVGEDGMTRRIADYPRAENWEWLNLLSSLGSYVLGLSIIAFAANIFVSWVAERPAGDDPWEGQTLEWATSSPPPLRNFDQPLPPILSYAPLWDQRHPEVVEREGTPEEVPAAGVGTA